MARRLALGLLAVAGGALAAPAAPPATWAEWVGEWQGKLRWSSCATEGEPTATLPVDAVDGVIAIDLGAAGGGLGALTLVEDNGGWVGQSGDVTVHVTRPRGETLDVDVALDSSCQVHASMHRPTIGIAACDRLSAWARVESRCTKLNGPRLEEMARLARQRETWAKATGDARAKIVAQCDARAQKVEEELIDAGCAPNPDPAVGLRGTECQALLHTTQRFARCAQVPADLAAIISHQAFALVGATQKANEADLKVLETECRRSREKIVHTAQQAGCPF
jgi:hypothetical protein